MGVLKASHLLEESGDPVGESDESAGRAPDDLASHQADRSADRGPQRRRQLVAEATDLADLGPDEDDLRHLPGAEHRRQRGQEMLDPEGMKAQLRAERTEVPRAEATDTA